MKDKIVDILQQNISLYSLTDETGRAVSDRNFNKVAEEILALLAPPSVMDEGMLLSDEELFYLHFNTPYKLSGDRKEMNAFLRGVADSQDKLLEKLMPLLEQAGMEICPDCDRGENSQGDNIIQCPTCKGTGLKEIDWTICQRPTTLIGQCFTCLVYEKCLSAKKEA